MKTVALVPVKLNNERLPRKNIKELSDGTPLIHLLLQNLVKCSEIDEIYVYCSDEKIKEYIPENIYLKKRDKKYDAADADVNDMFYRFSTEVESDLYVLAHVTSPFQTAKTIDEGIRVVKSGEYDSAIAVKKMQEFLWKDGKPLNYNTKIIPRTQDLDTYFVETTGLYIYTKNVIQTMRSRIGAHPYMLCVNPIEAIDINNPIDFEIANSIYTYMLNKNEETAVYE